MSPNRCKRPEDILKTFRNKSKCGHKDDIKLTKHRKSFKRKLVKLKHKIKLTFTENIVEHSLENGSHLLTFQKKVINTFMSAQYIKRLVVQTETQRC